MNKKPLIVLFGCIVAVVAIVVFFATKSYFPPNTKSASIMGNNYTNSIGMEFALIPDGSFSMGTEGSAEYGLDNEKPRHIVTISDSFYMGKHEVTQGQWEKIMGFNPSKFKNAASPVESISWHEAKAFISRLNNLEKTGRYRLPTEAEWEYAARATTVTKYSFGEDNAKIDEYGWYYDGWGNKNKSKTYKTHPVGEKKPNKWELYDMHGNVWEWVEDSYRADFYANSSTKDPLNYVFNSTIVIRGGSWINSPEFLRSAIRHNKIAAYKGDDTGFRVVMMTEEPN